MRGARWRQHIAGAGLVPAGQIEPPVQRQIRARQIVVVQVGSQHVTKVPFAKHDDMVDPPPTDQTDGPFDISTRKPPGCC